MKRNKTVRDDPADPIARAEAINLRISKKVAEIRTSLRHPPKQFQVGEILGFTHSQINRIENGNARIAACHLEMMAEFYDVPVSAFFEPLKDAPPEPDGPLLSSKARSLAEKFDAIEDPKSREAFENLLEQVLGLSASKDKS